MMHSSLLPGWLVMGCLFLIRHPTGTWAQCSSVTSTGSTLYTDVTNYNTYQFSSSGSITFNQPIVADVLVIGGGGAGGKQMSGGGGAGAVIFMPGASFAAGTYSITVGSGGAIASGVGGNGISSSIGSVFIAQGGGGGGSWYSNGGYGTKSGQDGGSGGGAAACIGSTQCGGASTPGGSTISTNTVNGIGSLGPGNSPYVFGNSGGTGQNQNTGAENVNTCLNGGGGGGAGSPGGNNVNGNSATCSSSTPSNCGSPGTGGNGINSATISSTSYNFASFWGNAYTTKAVSGYIAGGGGGGGYALNYAQQTVAGGLGGGGTGTKTTNTLTPTAGQANTGSGGGGSGDQNNPAAGGSGLVLIRVQCCPAGKYPFSAGICNLCTAGSYSTVGASTCTPCPAGTYGAALGASSVAACTSCPVNTYSASGAGNCTLCPANSWSPAGAGMCTANMGYYDLGPSHKAYWSFNPSNFVGDTTGVTGSLTNYGSVAINPGPSTGALTGWAGGSQNVAFFQQSSGTVDNTATNPQYFSLPGFTVGSQVSACVWFYPTANTIYTRVFDIGNSGSGNDGKNLQISYGGTNALTFQFCSGGTCYGGGMTPTGTGWSLNQWQHTCIVIDSSSTPILKGYYNGALFGTTWGSFPSFTSLVYSNNAPFIGRSKWGGTDPLFQGYMDEIRIFSKALTTTDVQAVYAFRGDTFSSMLFANCSTSCNPPVTYGHCTPTGGSVCCGSGQYFREGVDSACQACGAGTYGYGNASSCLNCPANTYSLTGAGTCTSCPANTTSTAGSPDCVSAPGFYMTLGGRFPPSGMTGLTVTIAGERFDASASSIVASNEDAFGAFGWNSGTNTDWTSGLKYSTSAAVLKTYAGTQCTPIDGVSQCGEYLQLKVGSARILGQYSIQAAQYAPPRAPASFIVAGSNDGTTWTQIDSQTTFTTWSINSIQTFTPTRSLVKTFTYFRLIVLATGSTSPDGQVKTADGYVSVEEWMLYPAQINACPTGSTSSAGAGACTPVVGNYDLGSSLLAYYPFNSGNFLADVSGITGALTGSTSSPTSQSSGPFGSSSYSVFLAAGSSQYFSVPSITFSSTFTICLWYNIDSSIISTSYQNLFDFASGTVGQSDFLAYLPGLTSNVQINSQISGSSIGTLTLTGAATTKSSWYHLAVTVSSTSGYAYINGAQVATVAYTSSRPTLTLQYNSIGRNSWESPAKYWTGAFDEFRIYNRLLTNSEIQAIYNFQGTGLNTLTPVMPLQCSTSGCTGLTPYGHCNSLGSPVCCGANQYFRGGTDTSCTACPTGTYAYGNTTYCCPLSSIFSSTACTSLAGFYPVPITQTGGYSGFIPNTGRQYVQFTSTTATNTFQFAQNVTAQVLVVGGGGAGGQRRAGGGGAGALIYTTYTFLANTTYTVQVGTGGAANSGGSAASTGVSGTSSQILQNSLQIFMANGGGGGGADLANGVAGGCSGGAGGLVTPLAPLATNNAAGSLGTYGYTGGSGSDPSANSCSGTKCYAGGGGGGAGAAGSSATSFSATISAARGGAGGNGYALAITGTMVVYAAGGGGGSNDNSASAGGAGGGANVNGVWTITGGYGGNPDGQAAGSAVQNTGSGGGGSGVGASPVVSYPPSGAGANGVVIIGFEAYVACPAGTTSTAGATTCTSSSNVVNCPAGSGLIPSSQTCQPCSTGSWSSGGSMQCQVCASNSWSAAGASTCTANVGYYNLASSQLAHYSFNPDNFLGDTTGKTGSLTNVGSVTAVAGTMTGWAGGAQNVASLSAYGQYLAMPALNVSSSVSVCAWYYSTGIASTASVYDLSNAYTSLNIMLLQGTSQQHSFTCYPTSSQPQTIQVPSSFPTNTWLHSCMVVSQTNLQVYVNYASTFSATMTSFPGANYGSGNCRIGGTLSSANTFQGYIDEVRIFNKALTAQDVQAVYSFRDYTNVSLLFATCSMPSCNGTVRCTPTGTAVCCYAGQFFLEGISLSCQACPSGNYSNDGSASTCFACPAGMYTGTSGVCTKCQAGTYSNLSAATVCQNCSVGQYSTTTGALTSGVCQNCSAGGYSPTTGAGVCQNCSAGQYNPSTGATVCQNCLAGTYSLVVAAQSNSTCQNCQAGTFSASNGSSTCTQCGQNSKSQPGSSQCTANVGFFLGGSLVANFVGNATIPAASLQAGTIIAFNRDVTTQVSSLSSSPVTATSVRGTTVLTQDGKVIGSSNGYPVIVDNTTGQPIMPYRWYKFDSANCIMDSGSNSSSLIFYPGKGAGTGNCATNSSNNTRMSPVIKAVKGDSSAFFNADINSFYNVPMIPILDLQANGMTIAFWGNFFTINTNGNANFFSIQSQNSQCNIETNKVLFSFWITSNPPYSGFQYTNMWSNMNGPYDVDNQWHHYVLGTDKTGNWYYWLDGKLISCPSGLGCQQPTNPAILPSPSQGYSYSFYFNQKQLGTCTYASFADEAMDDFRVYSTLLNNNQVAELYSGSVGIYAPGYVSCTGSCPTSQTLHCSSTGIPVCCGSGQYFREGVDSSCQQCPAGYNSDGSASYCTTCPAGQIVNGSACSTCQAGTYSSQAGMSSCTSCNAGTYSSGANISSSGACTACIAGTFSPTLGATSSIVCSNCSSGTYQPLPGATNSSACTACQAGTFSTGTGIPSSLSCSNCSAGTFSNSSGASSNSTCSLCSAGYYSTTSGAPTSSLCLTCSAGTWSTSSGLPASVSCNLCGAGTFSVTSGASLSAACTNCNAGKYSTTSGAPNSSLCQNCTAGTFSSSLGATISGTCQQCQAGSYSSGIGAVSNQTCSNCSAGQYSPALGAVSVLTCTNCTAGTYSSTVGATVAGTCLLCQAGSFSTAIQAASSLTCTNCSAGQYSTTSGAPNSSFCLNCMAGTFSSSLGAAISGTCQQCQSGAYSSVIAAVSSLTCSNCTAGQYSSASGAISIGNCTNCTAGQYSSTVGASFAGTCQQCQSGAYSSVIAAVSSLTCSNCTAGQYSTTLGAVNASFCLNCTTGTYSSNVGAVTSGTCLLCQSGAYSSITAASSNQTCLSCPPGSFSPTPGASTSLTCTNCSAGTYSTSSGATGSDTCSACPIGNYSVSVRSTSCASCPPNSTTNQNSSTQLGQCLCNAGFSGDTRTGQANPCSLCVLNSYCPGGGYNLTYVCPNSTYSWPGSSALGNCSCPGNASIGASNNCTCNPGYQRFTSASYPGSWTCLGCPQNTYCRLGALSSCPGNSTSPELSQNISNCLCNAGFAFYNASSSCILCTKGFYAVQGSLVCLACPSYSNTTGTGATAVTSCVCYEGYFGTPGGGCTLCPINTYCVGNLSTPCPNGLLAPPAANNISQCGCPTNAAIMPALGLNCTCASGFYQFYNSSQLLGGWQCNPCPPNSYCYLQAKKDCPAFATSPAYSHLLSNCTCNNGYYWNNSGAQPVCMPCPPNSYCSSNNIAQCPANTNSPANSVLQADCVCNAGFSCTRTFTALVAITMPLDAQGFSQVQAQLLNNLSSILSVPGASVANVTFASSSSSARRLLELRGTVPVHSTEMIEVVHD